MRSGVILAGGRSTRFGEGDKAVADLAGTPMIRRVADRLRNVVDDLVVNCRPEQTPALRNAMAGYPLDVGYAEDETPDRGPVAGIRNGLAVAGGEYSLVVACDMPFVDPALVDHLFDRAASHDAAVPRLDDGWFQTTQAVYRTVAMRRACDVALDRGDRRIVAPLEDLDYVVVEGDEIETVASTESFENVNSREDLQTAIDRLDSV
ncbi:molybdenum cofactor guanylyltransferase [Halobacteriales archaeon QH_2_65_14]|nr:MAG: molybdenum cofactor guanylyltransferase [Halobacteriales archaeon QH_2_65_14]